MRKSKGDLFTSSMMRSILPKWTTAVQFAKFCAVGALNTGIHYGVFLSLFRYMEINYLISSMVGYSCGILNSFVWNKLWTFQARGTRNEVELAKFTLVNLASLSANTVSLRCFVSFAGLSPEVGQLLAIGLSIAINFIGNKFWTFRTRAIPKEFIVSSEPTIGKRK